MIDTNNGNPLNKREYRVIKFTDVKDMNSVFTPDFMEKIINNDILSNSIRNETNNNSNNNSSHVLLGGNREKKIKKLTKEEETIKQ
jgi:hypothetical protein